MKRPMPKPNREPLPEPPQAPLEKPAESRTPRAPFDEDDQPTPARPLPSIWPVVVDEGERRRAS